jgi:formylglycine-generating enzyme required for sulfatase activity
MRRVRGGYCPAPLQVCLEWNEVFVGGKTERQQCRRYREPAECISKTRVPMDFCMDVFEWPNQRGTIPRNLTSWQEAKDACEGIGKRLCTDVEFTFACEGEAMRPHVTGFVRDASKCSFDREYRERKYAFEKHDACAASPPCREALEKIDQRLPAGSMKDCVSDQGIFDLNGNVNEWVTLPGKGFSKRAGLKGGWWGPVRDRCRPITTFHGESDFGYEVGFRCCRDADR